MVRRVIHMAADVIYPLGPTSQAMRRSPGLRPAIGRHGVLDRAQAKSAS